MESPSRTCQQPEIDLTRFEARHPPSLNAGWECARQGHPVRIRSRRAGPQPHQHPTPHPCSHPEDFATAHEPKSGLFSPFNFCDVESCCAGPHTRPLEYFRGVRSRCSVRSRTKLPQSVIIKLTSMDSTIVLLPELVEISAYQLVILDGVARCLCRLP